MYKIFNNFIMLLETIKYKEVPLIRFTLENAMVRDDVKQALRKLEFLYYAKETLCRIDISILCK